MDGLFNKITKAAGVKADPGESAEQTMKEHTVEKILKDKVAGIAGADVANKAATQKAIAKVADAIGDKVPAKALAAAASASASSKDKQGSHGGSDLMGQAMGMLGKKK